MEIAVAVMIALRPVSAAVAAAGSGMAAGMFLVTLTFLVSTPGWEPAAGGFPALSVVPGQFLLKDVVLLEAAVWSLGEALAHCAPASRYSGIMHSLAGRSTLALALVVTLGASLALFADAPAADPATSSWAKFDVQGHLRRPDGWRGWVYIGTSLTPNDLNPPEAPFPEFHNVYIDPDSYAHYARTGEFREGTILVKELVSVGTKAAPSGKGYFIGEFIGLEATVKSAERFPDEPGHWGYFTFSHSAPPYPATARRQPTASCNACHGQTAADDWVFTQFYPVLRGAGGSEGMCRR